MSTSPIDQALERLETKLAYQEASLQALDEALIAQAARIEHLERINRMLVERMRGDEATGPVAASQREELPPHY